MKDAALAYAEAAWSVFPLTPSGKTPATAHGFHDATTNLDQVDRWWTDNPTANVGIATEATGLVVIDVDAKTLEQNGWTTWLDLADRHAGETPTLEVTTPTGGGHLYYAAPAGDPVPSSAGKVAPYVDVRARGGYVVAPPSVTPVGVYELEARPVAACPDWLTALLRPVRRPQPPATAPRGRTPYGTAALTAEAAEVAAAAEGTRNHRLNEAAFSVGQLVARGDLDTGDAVTTLLDAARRAGLSDREAEATIASGLRAGHDCPRVA